MTNPDSIRADAILCITNISDEQARDAALVLAGHAADAGELRQWLEAIGFLPYEPGIRPTQWGHPRQMPKGTAR